jgi:hypothetical protein
VERRNPADGADQRNPRRRARCVCARVPSAACPAAVHVQFKGTAARLSSSGRMSNETEAAVDNDGFAPSILTPVRQSTHGSMGVSFRQASCVAMKIQP